MIAGIVVTLPVVSRPACLPARLVINGTNSRSRLWLARRMAEDLATALPGRTICVVADAAYAGKDLRGLPAAVTWTTRLRKDAAPHELPPPRTGRRGRPRVKGARLPSLDRIAAAAAFAPLTVTRYRKTAAVQATVAGGSLPGRRLGAPWLSAPSRNGAQDDLTEHGHSGRSRVRAAS